MAVNYHGKKFYNIGPWTHVAFIINILRVSLTDNIRVVIYNRNTFTVQANGVESLKGFNSGRLWPCSKQLDKDVSE